ncbi:MAG: hypothetical protein LUH42_00760 [Oscillospiraceae bacterium]|nr:hypothetical protein [Oscillospiraceae bacterium]
MKVYGKVALCLLAVALTGYLFLVDYPRLMTNLNGGGTAETAETAETVDSQEAGSQEADESASQSEPQEEASAYIDAVAQETALEEELEQLYQQRAATSVALCFEQIGEVVYDDIYPVLSEQGEPGTVVFTNGLLTGDNYQVMTDEFHTMMDHGWSYAIGGDGTDAENAAAWQTSLETYMANILKRTDIVPLE